MALFGASSLQDPIRRTIEADHRRGTTAIRLRSVPDSRFPATSLQGAGGGSCGAMAPDDTAWHLDVIGPGGPV